MVSREQFGAIGLQRLSAQKMHWESRMELRIFEFPLSTADSFIESNMVCGHCQWRPSGSELV